MRKVENVAAVKETPEVGARAKTNREIIMKTFPPADDEILRIHPVGKMAFRLNFWNRLENKVIRSLFIEVADGKAAIWPEGAES